MNAVKTVLLTLFSVTTAGESANVNITSPFVTNWGIWGDFQRCPYGKYVRGFQLKMEHYNKISWDYTGLNGIRLFCVKPGNPDLTSAVGEFGSWGKLYICSKGFLSGFQLQVESYQESGDDTATNDVKFFCSNPNEWMGGEEEMVSFGEYGEAKKCGSGQYICGLQTQVEPYQGDGDDTSLNNFLVECCDYIIPEM